MAELQEQTIIVIGKTGSGKSRLINLMLKQKRAQSCRSTMSVTRRCNMYKIFDDKNGVIHAFIDTMGLADINESNDQIIEKIKDFMKTDVKGIHWIIVALNGTERLTEENTQILKDILLFLDLKRNIRHVLFCVTHADGWNQRTQEKYTEDLRQNATFGEFTEDGPVQIFYSGVPDPDELEDEIDKEYAKKKEENGRDKLFKMLTIQQKPVLEAKIKQWKQMDIDKNTERVVRQELEKQRQTKTKKFCTIL